MGHLIKFLILFVCCSCFLIDSYAFDRKDLSDTSIHFYSIVNKAQFDTLSSTEFTWTIFEPINDTISFIPFRNRDVFIQKLSDKQKALFYIWQLERSIMQDQSGFTNLYYNYYKHLPEIISGLKIINDNAMLDLIFSVNKFYLLNYKEIKQKYQNGEWNNVKKLFFYYDKIYLDVHQHTMKLLEDYIRSNPKEFVRFK